MAATAARTSGGSWARRAEGSCPPTRYWSSWPRSKKGRPSRNSSARQHPREKMSAAWEGPRRPSGLCPAPAGPGLAGEARVEAPPAVRVLMGIFSGVLGDARREGALVRGGGAARSISAAAGSRNRSGAR